MTHHRSSQPITRVAATVATLFLFMGSGAAWAQETKQFIFPTNTLFRPGVPTKIYKNTTDPALVQAVDDRLEQYRQRSPEFRTMLDQLHSAAAQSARTQDADTLALISATSLESILAAAIQTSFVKASLEKDRAAALKVANATMEVSYPDAETMRVPTRFAALAHNLFIRFAGARLRDGEQYIDIAGEYKLAVDGTCPFDVGAVRIRQTDFLVEGLRDEALLFYGTVGPSQANIVPVGETRIRVTRSASDFSIEVPDAPSDLLIAAIHENAQSVDFASVVYKSCRMTLERKSVH